jgi:hypothetical protein
MVKQNCIQLSAESILNNIKNYFIKLKTDKSQWANLLLKLKT